MTKAIRVHAAGGADVLKWEDVEVGAPGEGEVRLRHTAEHLGEVQYIKGLLGLTGAPL